MADHSPLLPQLIGVKTVKHHMGRSSAMQGGDETRPGIAGCREYVYQTFEFSGLRGYGIADTGGPLQQQQPTRSVGLREIAEQLNVSVSLVSKVLNGRLGNSGAKPNTVAAIRAAARAMGYH